MQNAITDFRETSITAPDGTVLFLRSIEPGRKPKASVLLTHGMGEHSARYLHVAEFLAANGYRLCTYDLRGHGRSTGRRGYIRGYDELLDDLERVRKHFKREGERMFLYGHSMGAQVTLNYLLGREPDVQGAIITSPWLELAFRPSRWKVLLAKIMLNLWPTFTQDGPHDDALLSRDAAFIAAIPGRELVHCKMSARMFYELTTGAQRAIAGAREFNCPMLLIHGAEDPLTSAAATKSFFQAIASRDKTLKIYPGMRHETHNDSERETVIAGIVDWLNERCATFP